MRVSHIASLLAGVACLAAPILGYAQRQAGWSELQLQAATAGCTEAIVGPAKADFAKRAAKAGDDKAIFPEKELRSSVEPMCACITERIATTWAVGDWQRNMPTYKQFVEEAFAGGRCKPEGVLGEALDRARSKSAK